MPPPPRTINDLPTELKARIAQLCSEQDELYRSWVKTVGIQDAFSYPHEVLDDLDETKLYGHSLAALYGASNEWCMICEPFRASRVTLEFKDTVAPLRSSRFTHLDLDTADPDKMGDTLALLPLFPVINTGTLGWNCVVFLKTASPVADLIAPRLQSLIASVSAVNFVGLDFHHFHDLQTHLVAATASSSAMRSLHLTVEDIDGTFDRFPAYLATLSHLEELSLTVGDPQADIIAFEGGGLVRPAPPLRRLSLSSPVLTDSAVAFAQQFSATLTSLFVTYSSAPVWRTPPFGLPNDWTSPSFAGCRFPVLRTLLLDGPAEWTRPTFLTLSPDSFPALSHIVVGPKLLCSPNDISFAALSTLSPFSSLRVLTIRDAHHWPPRGVSAVRAFCKRQNLRYRETSSIPLPGAPFFSNAKDLVEESRSSEPLVGADTVALTAASLHATADFLRRRADGAAATEDHVALARLVEILRPVELERLAMEK
ncbi:hypothetical protein JCM10213_008658 [Rhodosporidiobolus nylandii]